MTNKADFQVATPRSAVARPAAADAFRDGRRAGDRWRYRGAITREQWLLNEARTVARLRIDEGLEDDEVLRRNREQNLFQYPTEREIASLTRACLLRLDNLSEDPGRRQGLTGLIAHGTPSQARQANLYAMMRTYRVVWEFMVSLVGRKLQSFYFHLERAEVAAFLESLREQSDEVASWSDSTFNKIRQVLVKCLVETGYLKSSRDTQLVPPLLDLDLEVAVRANGDGIALPAFNIFN